MSSWGINENCYRCYCYKNCKYRRIDCNPCMDCEDYPNDQINEDHVNGYIPIDNRKMCDTWKEND